MQVNAQHVQQDCIVLKLVWLIHLAHVKKGSIAQRDQIQQQRLSVPKDTFVQTVVLSQHHAHWEPSILH